MNLASSIRARTSVHTFAGVVAAVLCTVLVTALPTSPLRFGAAAALLLFLPGYGLSRLVVNRGGFAAEFERVVLGCGMSLALAIVLLYALNRCGVTISCRTTAPLLGAVSVAGFILRSRRSLAPAGQEGRSTAAALVWLVAILTLASIYRFPALGYSEFQGDEAKILLKVQELIAGDHDIIFRHKKGPGEVLLTAATGVMTGRMNELGVRLPFAVAGLAAVGAIYLAGRVMFGGRAGLVACFLAAINGYLIAFSRIMQYQSIVLLFAVLCLYCIYRADREDSRARAEGRFFAAGLFAAAAFLSHYEVAPAVPVFMVLLVQAFLRRDPLRPRRWVVAVVPLAAAASIAAFYVTLRLRPDDWAVFWQYLSGSRVGSFKFHDNLNRFVIAGSMYAGLYYLVVLGGACLFLCVRELGAGRPRRWLLYLLLVAIVASAAHGVLASGQDEYYRRPLMFVGSVLLLGLFLAARGIRREVRLLVLWAGPFLLLYGYFMAAPGTHWYLAFPALIILGSAGLSLLWERVSAGRTLCVVGGVVVAAAACVLAYYPYLMFVSHSPEYAAAYPRYRNRLFIMPYGDRMPDPGIFGFPDRDGWRTLGWLFKSGSLAGTYRTNEEASKVEWYLGQGRDRSPFPERFVIIARHPQLQFQGMYVNTEGYRLRCVIRNSDEQEIEVYERAGFRSSVLTIDRELYDRAYEGACTTVRLMRDGRLPNRNGADDYINGYWHGRFREPGDKRTKEEMEVMDRVVVERGLTRIYQDGDFRNSTGVRVRDPLASDGRAIQFRDGKDRPDCLVYGPYGKIPAGAYIVRFYLRAEGRSSTTIVARLDVAAGGGEKVLGVRELHGRELAGQDGYRSYAVRFVNDTPGARVEFRVDCPGGASVFFDRVEISVDIDASFAAYVSRPKTG